MKKNAQYTPNVDLRWQIATRGEIEFIERVNKAIRSTYQSPILLPRKSKA